MEYMIFVESVLYIGGQLTMQDMEMIPKSVIDSIKADIEAEIEKEFYMPNNDICAEQYIRSGYLGALSIIDRHLDTLTD